MPVGAPDGPVGPAACWVRVSRSGQFFWVLSCLGWVGLGHLGRNQWTCSPTSLALKGLFGLEWIQLGQLNLICPLFNSALLNFKLDTFGLSNLCFTPFLLITPARFPLVVKELGLELQPYLHYCCSCVVLEVIPS